MVTLLELPEELICHVLSKLAANKDSKGRLSPLATGHRDIVGFACTCQRAWGLSEQFLYSAVLLRTAKEVKTLSHFYWTDERGPISTNQARGRHLSDLAVVPPKYGSRESNEEFLKLSAVIASMPAGQLARLHLELPYHQTYDSQFWFDFRSTFGKSIHGHISRFFILPWASRLEHCHLNFQQDGGRATTLDDLISVFSAPRLKSLVLVGFGFAFDIFNWSQIDADVLSKGGSSVERLSLHQCDVPPKAFKILLSMARSLRYLSYSTERWDRGWDDDVVMRIGLWKKVFGMCEHLVQQKDSLAQLDLDLGGLSQVESYEEQQPEAFGFRLGHLTSLTELTLRNQFPEEPEDARMLLDRLPCSLRRLNICDFPYTADGEAMVVAAQYYLTEDLSTNIGFQKPALPSAVDDRRIQTSKLLPNLKEFAVSFSDHNDPGKISGRLRDCFEYVGDRYRRELDWRFVVNRITEMRGAVPPYLWDERVVEFVKVYDNMANKNLWDSRSECEVKEDEECKRHEEIERRKRAAQEEHERFEAEEARQLGLSESLSPPSPPPSISPVSGSLSQSVATAAPANVAVVAAAMAMANANEGLT